MADSPMPDRRFFRFAPAPGGARVRHCLPLPLTSFVGRDDDLAAVTRLLLDPTVRLVALTGTGGVGKTRLALAASRALGDRFADGIRFVPLAAVAHAALVPAAIGRAFGLRESEYQPMAERLFDALGDRRLLLLLDNVEHVVDAGPFVVALLAHCPGLTILATSRVSLGVSGEHVVSVPPLGLPRASAATSTEEVAKSDAARLFVARASAVRNGFGLTEDNAAAVAAVVERLDGLPLAIELAAARIACISPSALLDLLDRRLPLLTGGGQDLPARQRTMTAAFDWSYDLLSDEERVLFRRLSIFDGGFSLEAAAEVLATPSTPRVLDGVASLVARSLVQPAERSDGIPRFAMLETVREYGVGQLVASGEDQVVRRLHASWCVDLAERADPAIWGGPEHRRWLDCLESELPNLRAALVWLDDVGDGPNLLRLAAALGGLWHYRSHRAEGRRWLERALNLGGRDAPAARAMALVKIVLLDRTMGRRAGGERLAEAITLRRELGDQRGVGRALILHGAILMDGPDFHAAAQVLDEAAALLGPLGDMSGVATTRLILGRAALARGDIAASMSLLGVALDLYRRDGFEYGVAETLLALGKADVDRGAATSATARYAECLRLFDEIGSREGLGDALAATGRLALRCRCPDAAATLLGAANGTNEALGHMPSPGEQAANQQAEAAARDLLGEIEFARVWAAGRALPPDMAVSAASEVLAAVGTRPTTCIPAPPFSVAILTPRERQVLALVAEGASDREVGAVLFINPGTVRSHLTNIFGKLGVGSRTGAVAAARRLDLV